LHPLGTPLHPKAEGVRTSSKSTHAIIIRQGFIILEIKKYTEWFSVQDCVIHARGIFETFGHFRRFPKVEKHPKCMDHSILHKKTAL
jgi:hypothetical protein